jgi:three-Cys-motif partner protein
MNVAVPKDTIWPIEPHTSAKHQILRKYLDAWLPILGTYNKRIIYVDGFAGPGRYTGGEPGSPIVALEAALTHQAKLPGELVFLFIEKKTDRADHLSAEIAKLQLTPSFKVQVQRGSFADEYAHKARIEMSAPHDLRRTCARLCHAAGGELEQIQFILGHVSIQTTERYLGCKQRIRSA